MEEARKTGIHSLVRFVRTLKQDLSAVEAAVGKPWGNGPVEGQLGVRTRNGNLNNAKEFCLLVERSAKARQKECQPPTQGSGVPAADLLVKRAMVDSGKLSLVE